ncbi:MAG: right-handed parallel beta-helix repeat-containing protein [Victivallaceae bacterium]|nr:right-handed parallel beta-helix repeat-containing protein [Victivallaceae bacterium]
MSELKKFFGWVLCMLFLAISSPGKESIVCEAKESSLRQAIESARKISGEKEIVLADGTLFLTAPIVLDERDSGLTIRGSGGTVVSGGVPLSFSTVQGKPYWAAKIPEGLPAPQLLSGDAADIPVAIYPHAKMAKYLETTSLIWLGSQYGGWDRPPRDFELDRISVPPAELPGFDPEDAEIYLPHSWNSSLVRVKSVDRKTGVIVFANLLRYPAGGFNVNTYQIRNIEAGLCPGKWMYKHATREVFYYPKENERIESVKLTASVTDQLLKISGAHNVSVENVTFSHCNGSNANDPGHALNEPDRASRAVEVSDCRDITFSNVTVSHCRGNGIFAAGTPVNHSIRVLDCRIFAVGVTRIVMTADGNCVIRNCDIRDCEDAGIDARTNRGSHFEIVRNKICGTGYCGLIFHAISGGAEKPFDVAIEDNDISRIMQDEARHDGAGIYVFGAEKFRVNRNTVRETPSFGLRHGIYFDETSNHCTAVGNHISTFFPVMVHKAQDITFQDCRFDFTGPMKFDLVDSDRVLLKNCTITAPEILFSAPEGGLQRKDCKISGNVTENVKKHNFTFSVDDFGILHCNKIPAEKKNRTLPRRIVCLGDSITSHGFFAGELQLYLSCRYPRERIEVFNAGIGGDTASGGFRRLERDVLSKKPDMAIICFGMNDVGRDLYKTCLPSSEEEAALREKCFQSYCENMKKIVDALVDRGIEVVVMAPFPYDEYGTRPAPDQKYEYCNCIGLEKLAAHCYNTYAPKVLFPMSRMMLCRLYAWFPELQIAKDRVHPDRRGHWVIANEIVKTVFRDLPAQDPVPFPVTLEMAEFAKIGEGKKYPCDTVFAPLDTLIENGARDGETIALRTQLEAWLAADGVLRQLEFYDDILRKKGFDPDDVQTVDPVLDDFAQRWHLASDLKTYRRNRAIRKELIRNAENAKKEYFILLDKLSSSLQRENKSSNQ